MKPLVVASNMLNEVNQLERWFDFVKPIADGGILIVDGGSCDGTQKFCALNGAIVVEDEVIQRSGYGTARNHLRTEARKYFPETHWIIYLDADETISEQDFHKLRFLKDYLIEDFDIIALPRIDWKDLEMTEAAKDWRVNPDFQARMTRLNAPIEYYRKLHEQVRGFKQIYTNTMTPKINHFHRSADQSKRDFIGKVCAKLHMEDDEYGGSYPMHHKEQHYRDLLEKEGLGHIDPHINPDQKLEVT